MRTNNITPISFSGLKAIKIKPKYKENADRPYLYNEILDLTKKMKVPANFHTNKIEMPSPTQALLTKLKELGIFYSEVK